MVDNLKAIVAIWGKWFYKCIITGFWKVVGLYYYSDILFSFSPIIFSVQGEDGLEKDIEFSGV